MPKINDMLLKLEEFQYSMSLVLIIGYYHIQFIDNASNLCTIIIAWGNYCYKVLPMGVANSPVILKQKMNYLFHGFKLICEYIDDLLILTKVDWTYHVKNMKLTLNKMKKKKD